MLAAHRGELRARNDMQVQERVATCLMYPRARVAIDLHARIRWLAIAPALE